jgi:endonuclease/exonuclease/phosphatase family metal-dependent hydrolase
MAAQLKILTYNCWHALTVKNLVEFRDLEPEGRRQKRYEVQLENFKKLDPDILFLQEVSPLHVRTLDFENLGYELVSQVDQSGVKLFGFGIPNNLSTGLAILAKPGLNLKKLFGQKLSGQLGFTGTNFSLQLSENRYALFAKAQHPEWGNLLLVNTHLHHGTENTPLIEKMLSEALTSQKMNQREYKISKNEIRLADLRRKNELDILFSAVHVFEKSFDRVLLAGDFNSSESGQAYRQVLNENYLDTFRTKHLDPLAPDYLGFTWDNARNLQNIDYGHEFELPMDNFGRADIRELFNVFNDRQRRIDFLFFKELKSGADILKSQVIDIASQRDGVELFGSDHLGLLTEIGLK